MSDWIVQAKSRPLAQHVLLICHHAGGFALSYLPWLNAFGDDWELIILELPGRGLHRKGEPVRSWENLCERALPELGSVVGERRLHIFGHSFGGCIAYKLAEALEKGRKALGSVVISAIGPYAAERFHNPQTAEEFMRKMEDPAYLPSSIRTQNAALQQYRHNLQSDIDLIRQFRMDSTLSSRLLIAGALDDSVVHPDSLKAWLDLYPKAEFQLFPGDHFYWRDELLSLAGWIVRKSED